MQTQCPECQTTFNITQQHLDIANGQVRCTQCQTIFDGHANMHRPQEPPHLDDIAHIKPHQESPNKSDTRPNPLIFPDLIEQKNTKPSWGNTLKNVLLGLVSTALLATLLIQVAYLKRSELARIAPLAPYIQQACRTIAQCTIPAQRALEQFRLESRNVYAHPNTANALVVTATFSNQAEFRQAYPTLMLSMSNVRGQEVATRRFTPAEYLDKFSTADAGMAPQQSSSISLELADPGEQAMAFEIDFQ